MDFLHYRKVAPRILVLSLGLAVAVGSAAFTQGGVPASAQEGDPPVVALHRGSCSELEAAPVADLGVLAPYGQVEGQEAAVFRGLVTNNQGVMFSSLTLEMPFDDVFSEQTQHALAVHQDAATFGTLLACGEAAGADVDGRVVIGLQPVGDARYAGIAILDDDDAGFLGLGENQTQIATYLVSLGASRDSEADSTPVATDAAIATPQTNGANGTDQDEVAAQGDQDAETVEPVSLEAVDIDYNPNQISIPANTDAQVLFRNTGAIEHTFTIDELGIDEVLAPGEEREITINADAGEYVFYCTVPGHRQAGQEGVLTVE